MSKHIDDTELLVNFTLDTREPTEHETWDTEDASCTVDGKRYFGRARFIRPKLDMELSHLRAAIGAFDIFYGYMATHIISKVQAPIRNAIELKLNGKKAKPFSARSKYMEDLEAAPIKR